MGWNHQLDPLIQLFFKNFICSSRWRPPGSRVFTRKTSGLGGKNDTEDGGDHRGPNFVGISVAEHFDLGAGNPSIIYHCNMKFSFKTEAQKEQTDSIILWTRFFSSTQTHHGNVALPFLRCFKVYLMRWRFFGGSKSWPLFQSDHFFSSFWVPTGGGWRFLPSQLIKLQTFQIASSCIFFNTKVQILDCESATWWWSVSTQKKSGVRKTDAKTSLEIWV